MWEITHPDHVTDRICTFLDDAEEAIHHLVTREDVLDRRIDAALQEASDRGVTVTVEVATADVREHLANAVPGADVTVASDLATTNPVIESWPGQLVLVDKRAVVATGVNESDLPDVTEGVAVWTHGRDHGFAAWIRELLDDRLAELEPDQWSLETPFRTRLYSAKIPATTRISNFDATCMSRSRGRKCR